MTASQASEKSHFLMAYFLSETGRDGEQVRLAVSDGSEPTAWSLLNGGQPILRSGVGEGGTRDPFLIRDGANDRFVLIATDLRVWPDEDWDRAVRRGSRNVVVWESDDLVHWEGPVLRELSPPSAGNTWAPKAFWSHGRRRWLVFWASAIYADADDRAAGQYQRIMVAETKDFREFGPARVHLDLGHDVIDLTFLEHAGRWFRFSANAQSASPRPDVGHHIFEEEGRALEDPHFAPLSIDIGKEVMVRAEGPATAKHPTEDRWYLLADEFGLRGYQVFESDDLATGRWRHRIDARMPEGARHGSLLPISSQERESLLAATWE